MISRDCPFNVELTVRDYSFENMVKEALTEEVAKMIESQIADKIEHIEISEDMVKQAINVKLNDSYNNPLLDAFKLKLDAVVANIKDEDIKTMLLKHLMNRL